MSLLSRGDLRELAPLNWWSDGRDNWVCANCGEVMHDDRKVMYHPKSKDECLCQTCAESWAQDNL